MCSWETPIFVYLIFVYLSSFYWINVARSNLQTLCEGKNSLNVSIVRLFSKKSSFFLFFDAFEIETRQILTLCLPHHRSLFKPQHKTNWELLQEPPSRYPRRLKSLNPISNKQMNQRGFMSPKNVKYHSVSNP